MLAPCRECEASKKLQYSITNLFIYFYSTLVHVLTRSVSGSVVVHCPSQDLAEAAFDLVLQAGHVEVLFM